jgi:hypothetical protein
MNIGTFELKSGKLLVSDPCYTDISWCQLGVERAKIGTWKASIVVDEVSGWGERVHQLLAVHSSFTGQETWTKEGKDIGVDSGTAGIFDVEQYPFREGNRRDEFYEACGAHTLSDHHAGCVDIGAVSSAGFGDGGYPVYIARNKDGEVVGVRIDFITEADLEEAAED